MAASQIVDSSQSQVHRYHFNCSGVVKRIEYPNKAILHFRLNGQDEKAILLSKMLTIDGKPYEELNQDGNKLLQDLLKINDVVHFDCHVYDKGGGLGSGKDRCNFFAMRAWRNSGSGSSTAGGGGTGAGSGVLGGSGAFGQSFAQPSTKFGTGWISELNPRKGVLTFENGGHDERVLFLASKVYFFEKRIGARQPLTDFLREGDLVQFEAVPQDYNQSSMNQASSTPSGTDIDNCSIASATTTTSSTNSSSGTGPGTSNSYCSWFANLVWKGKRPPVDSYGVYQQMSTPPAAVPAANLSQLVRNSQNNTRLPSNGSNRQRRDSYDSSDGSEYGNDAAVGSGTLALVPGVPCEIIRGVGTIAKIVDEKSGIIWWVRGYNRFQSVWFTSSKTFMFGTNLAGTNLQEIFREGDPVSLLVEKSPANFPTKYIAKQVLVSENTATVLEKALESPANPSNNVPKKPEDKGLGTD